MHIFKILLIFIVIFFSRVHSQDIRLKGTKKNKPQEKEQTSPIKEERFYEITGKVMDSKTSEPLPGVKIYLKDKTEIGTLTDLNGNFYIKNLEPQNWTLVVNYIGYQPKEITEVNPQNLKSPLIISLQEVGVEMQEVVIQSNVRKEAEVSAILLQKNNLNISDVFSGDMILKSSSDLFINTALSRMPGISIVEDKYLVCRGMPERYNSILFNGALMPVLHADKQTFSFNNLPSNIISQIQLTKSYSSDIPGGFGAGVIGFETSDMPEKNQILFNYQLGFNPNISFQKDYFPKMDNSKGKIGTFSKVNGFLPDNFPDAQTIQNLPTHSDENANYGKQLNSHFEAIQQLVRPDQSLAFQLQRKYEWNENRQFGFTWASNFSEIFSKEKTQFKFFENFDKDLGYNPVSDSGSMFINKSTQTFHQVLNLNYSSSKFQLHWKNYFSKSQWSNFSQSIADYNFVDIDNDINVWYHYKYWLNRVEKQNLYSTQLISEYQTHKTSKSQSKILAKLFFNTSQYEIPLNYPLYSEYDSSMQDFRLTGEYLESFYDLIFMCNSLQKQNDRMIGTNLEWKYQKKLKENDHFYLSLGTFVLSQNRTFQSRNLGLVPAKNDSSLLDLTQFSVIPYQFDFPYSEIKPYHFVTYDITTDYSNYSAKALNLAPYIQAHWTFKELWIFHAGVRYEIYKPLVSNHFIRGQDTVLVQESQKDLLFNLGVSYQLNETMKLKTTYSSTIVRPDLRELSRLEYFDYYQSIFWAGNPHLKRTQIHNIDLRYEWFRNGKNLFSVTGFYKNIQTPIEQTLRQGDLGYVMVYELNNAKIAYNVGIELEARQQLAETGFLQNFKFYGNLMFQTSQVNDDRTGNTQRPLQGQSPYLINAGILFTEPKSKINVDIFYNRFGKQIVIVGTPEKFTNLYLLPRNRLDIQISRSFGKFQAKLAIQDVFNQPYIRRQYYDGGFYQDNKFTRLATLYTLALQYRF